MLTFEEFFLKKKIDLLQLASAEPDLFAEFSLHYPLMGEKSFDHTKKYWFNKLRRTYPLSTAIKPHPVKAENISKMAVQGMAAAAAQNLDPHLQKPKFTEDHLAELVGKDVSLKEVSLAEEEKEIVEKSGEMKSGEREQELATEPAKPAFKPRFNMQNIKKTPIKTALEESSEKGEDVKSGEQEEEPSTENPEPATEPAKPAFKPRFNMQNIKKTPIKTALEESKEKGEDVKSGEQEQEPATDN